MIANQAELERTSRKLTDLEIALSELRQRVEGHSRDRFLLMAESYLNEIEMLRGRIDDYIGLKEAREASTDFVLRIASAQLPEGVAPVSILSRVITGLQKGIQRLGEYVARTQFKVAEHIPSHTVAGQFELEVVVVAPGSFEVGLRIAGQEAEFLPPDAFAETFRRFARAAREITMQDASPQSLFEVVGDLNSQLQLLRSLKEITPSRRTRHLNIELSGRGVGNVSLVFGQQTRDYLSRLIRTTTRDATEEGLVREIDLDKRTFKIRAATAVVRCRYSADLEQQVKGSLDRKVRITGRATSEHDGRVKELMVHTLQSI